MKFKIFFLALVFGLNHPLYSQEIKYVSDFGNSLNPSHFEFGSIDDITVVEDKIYVLDSILNKVHLLILESEEIKRSGEINIQKGNGPGELNVLSVLAANENYLAIADARSRRVAIFSNEGDLVSQFNIRFRPTNMHLLGEENRLLATGFWPTVQDKILHVIDFNGNEIRTYIERPSNWMQIARTGNFERVLPGSGHFYVSYPDPYKIEKYDWNGVLIDSYVKNETGNNIQADGRILRIRQRIIDLNFWGDKILALVQNDDEYSIDIYDEDLNPVNNISGDTLETDHASTMRVISDDYFLIRQIGQIPYLRLYKIDH
jgi:hypothetical protein